MGQVTAMNLEWGVATMMVPGQTESGDEHLVTPTPEGMLVVAIDGLGHGNGAAEAARLAVGILRENPEEHVIALLRRCHEGLRSTRGVVMSLASFNRHDGMMTWIGVGNVEGVLLRANGSPSKETLLLRGGVVGSQLPPLQAGVLPIAPTDTLIFATDGVRSDFVNEVNLSDPPQTCAERIMARCAKGTDDALVLVVKHRGTGP
jgi:hypothetical protein